MKVTGGKSRRLEPETELPNSSFRSAVRMNRTREPGIDLDTAGNHALRPAELAKPHNGTIQ
jgi:hypothetical protein